MKVTSFEEACTLRGYDPATVLPNVSAYPAVHQEAIISLAKLIIIAEAMNEGRKFDWNDWEERKWYPWFDMDKSASNPSGFRFLVALYDGTLTCSAGGSRLCFETSEDAEWAGTHFIDLYRAINVIPD